MFYTLLYRCMTARGGLRARMSNQNRYWHKEWTNGYWHTAHGQQRDPCAMLEELLHWARYLLAWERSALTGHAFIAWRLLEGTCCLFCQLQWRLHFHITFSSSNHTTENALNLSPLSLQRQWWEIKCRLVMLHNLLKCVSLTYLSLMFIRALCIKELVSWWTWFVHRQKQWLTTLAKMVIHL